MQHIGRGVEDAAKAMPAEIAHHRHAMRLDVGLDRVADVAKGIAGPHRLDPFHQRVMRDLDQPLGFAAELARHIHPARVAEPTIEDHGDVDIQDVAVF